MAAVRRSSALVARSGRRRVDGNLRAATARACASLEAAGMGESGTERGMEGGPVGHVRSSKALTLLLPSVASPYGKNFFFDGRHGKIWRWCCDGGTTSSKR